MGRDTFTGLRNAKELFLALRIALEILRRNPREPCIPIGIFNRCLQYNLHGFPFLDLIIIRQDVRSRCTGGFFLGFGYLVVNLIQDVFKTPFACQEIFIVLA